MNESFAVFGLAHFLRNQVRGDTGARVWPFSAVSRGAARPPTNPVTCISFNARHSGATRDLIESAGWLPASTLSEREAPVNVHRRGFLLGSYHSPKYRRYHARKIRRSPVLPPVRGVFTYLSFIPIRQR